MSDANTRKRPLSPHLSIYRPQMSSTLSILHRITGVSLSLAAVLIVWWFVALSVGPAYFAVANGFLTSWLGIVILLASVVALWFHYFNGIRHLRWDAGVGLGKGEAHRSGVIVLVLAAVMIVVTIWAAV